MGLGKRERGMRLCRHRQRRSQAHPACPQHLRSPSEPSCAQLRPPPSPISTAPALITPAKRHRKLRDRLWKEMWSQRLAAEAIREQGTLRDGTEVMFHPLPRCKLVRGRQPKPGLLPLFPSPGAARPTPPVRPVKSDQSAAAGDYQQHAGAGPGREAGGTAEQPAACEGSGWC